MSEGIIIALIGVVGSVVVALIGTYGLIKSAQIKNETPTSTTRNSATRKRKNTPTKKGSKSTIVGAFIVFVFSIIYLALSASTAQNEIRPNRYIDMGASLKLRGN